MPTDQQKTDASLFISGMVLARGGGVATSADITQRNYLLQALRRAHLPPARRTILQRQESPATAGGGRNLQVPEGGGGHLNRPGVWHLSLEKHLRGGLSARGILQRILHAHMTHT